MDDEWRRFAFQYFTLNYVTFALCVRAQCAALYSNGTVSGEQSSDLKGLTEGTSTFRL